MRLENILTIALFLIEAAFAVHYWISWNRLKKSYKKSDISWPIASQADLRNIFFKNPAKAISEIVGGMSATIRIIFFMTTKNIEQKTALAGIRLSLIGFVTAPIVMMTIIVATYSIHKW